jgi:hypothetical protein
MTSPLDHVLREQQMFPDSTGRPVYGALNLAGYPDGASPRFEAQIHGGLRLSRDVTAVVAVPPLARFIADRYRAAHLDAYVIGRAARSVVRYPADWSASGTPAEVLQLIKYLWHILILRAEPHPIPAGGTTEESLGRSDRGAPETACRGRRSVPASWDPDPCPASEVSCRSRPR